ncbi:MAG TPA: cupin domain-containing protein [Solirubrobacteraceae bacterium]|nr:cupin domain-containing protein [Solirubrobacteraceae bacterium]
MDASTPAVVGPDQGERLWFLGTTATILIDGARTGGRYGAFHGLLPFDAAPPLHSHPQDESFYLLAGEVSMWIGDLPERRLGPGAMAFAPGGTPHTFRVETETAEMLVLSTPAGIEEYVRALGEPAQRPGLAPQGGPRDLERIAAVEQELQFVRHGPRPPAAAAPGG